MLSMLLTRIQSFVPIGCNLLLDLETHLLHTILNTKNLKFKYLIDGIVIDLILS